MLTQYKNINQIQTASGSISAERLSSSKTEFASFDAEEAIYFNTEINKQTEDQRVEIHVYAGDTWITGTHRVQLETKVPEYRNKQTNALIRFPAQPLAINLYNEFDKLKLTSGTFRIAVNFFKNLIGSYDLQHLRIDEISPDRTEIRLRAIDADNPQFLTQITSYIQTVKQTTNTYYKNYLLNFSRNNCVLFVNSVVIGEYLYVKLAEPLSADIDVDFKCWIVEEQKDTYIDRVSIIAKSFTKQYNTLSNPNWQANNTLNLSTETGFKTWTDLLGSSTQTSQQIVDSYFSGSLSGAQLNIDYSDFNNFIFYSSATERLSNFKYKLQLLEYYASQSILISQISGSNAESNSAEYTQYQTNLIGGFDAFEKYLYYDSSSKLTTYDIAKENAVYADLTGSYVQPVPKSTSTYPYALYSVTSSQFNIWYNSLLDSASLYDSFNLNSLEYSIPEFIRFNTDNEQMVLFVRMLGHHYDIIYSYINHMNQIHTREENPKLGMPNELLYTVAKQFGWNLTNGNQQQELWSYVLGTSETGTPQTGSNSVNGTSLSARDRTYTVWRRIVNNLPLLLKSKGTKRSVQALLSCYGIPQSMISINEYGGPRLERAPVYEKLNFDYALDLSGSVAGTVTVNYTAPINAVELRFRTDNIVTNPYIPNTMNLFTVGSNVVTIDFTSGNKGTIQLNGTSSADIEIYNDEWLTTVLRTNGTNLDLVIKKSKYGKIVASVSASSTASFASTGTITLGGTNGGSRFVGQLQELRLWSSSLQDAAFNNHVKAPAAYNGNVDAYSELLFRLPLTQKINHAQTGSLLGVQPVASTVSASFTGWTLATPYDSIEETYYYDAISLGAGTFDDNKIRIESNELIAPLDVKTRAERSQFDKAPLDSKKLGVYFSPQTMIDEDIIAQLGFTDLDQYIGDPSEVEAKSYPRLIQAAQGYWKKYADKNDINSYIKIFTLFDLSFFKQLDQLLPARTDKITGVLIQPNVLERSKDTILPKIKQYDSSYYALIEQTHPTASGEYLQYLGSIDGDILTISAQDDDQWQMYLTASQGEKYDGTTYSYEYLIRSGSTYITASTPYWRSEGLCPAITGSTLSEYTEYRNIINLTASYTPSQFSDYLPTGIDNQRYSGAKLTSPGFNVNSTQTTDGGPVVEWRTANPNQLIYQNNGEQGSFVLV
ncbi:hypothetical protein UFOVP723_167 [uncultured Caudovirales phage]|uniref:Concanavalin A-like lectin/glucanases superfamily n=1 Tax=uncultured Caudovirales phage TaxID=2100421 RepID=A0A6J5NNB6_9CAUD|nr:hypothetical protein UFOVP723_167 [uncultured Caudovirales phage]